MAPHNTHWPVDRHNLLPRLLDELNAALSEEWLSYYQYWMSARMVEGDHVDELRQELERAADDERQHADMLAERVTALGGVVPTTPAEWYRYARCTYDTPTQFSADYLLRMIKVGRQCARRRYDDIIRLTEGKDPVTNHLAHYLLESETEHIDALTQLLSDATVARRLANPA